ncbi:MAG TPA: hypothetical protein VGK06_04135 [Methanosarcina sp.]
MSYTQGAKTQNLIIRAYDSDNVRRRIGAGRRRIGADMFLILKIEM